MKPSILLIDDEPLVGKRLRPSLEKAGYEVETFEDPGAALKRATERDFDVVVTDMRMESVTGMDVLGAALARDPQTRVIIITAYATMELAREALSKGAFEVLAKPFSPRDLRDAINRATAARGKAAS